MENHYIPHGLWVFFKNILKFFVESFFFIVLQGINDVIQKVICFSFQNTLKILLISFLTKEN